MLALGSEFPNFQGVTQHGLVLELDDHLDLTDNEMVETVTRAKNANDPKFSWMLLVTSDKALAPVFSTEILALAALKRSLDELGVQIVVVVNSTETEVKQLVEDMKSLEPDLDFDFLILCDNTTREKLNGQIAKTLQLTGADKLPVNTTYITNHLKQVVWATEYPSCVGRNFQEVLRSTEALQLTTSFEVGTAANWCVGEHVWIRSTLSEGKARRRGLLKGVRTVKPYMKLIPMPVPEQEEPNDEDQEAKAADGEDKKSAGKQTEGEPAAAAAATAASEKDADAVWDSGVAPEDEDSAAVVDPEGDATPDPEDDSTPRPEGGGAVAKPSVTSSEMDRIMKPWKKNVKNLTL